MPVTANISPTYVPEFAAATRGDALKSTMVEVENIQKPIVPEPNDEKLHSVP